MRTATPSFDEARDFISLRVWGLMFLAGATTLTLTMLSGRTAWMRAALYVGGVMYSWWAFLFLLGAIQTPYASVNSPAVYGFIAFTHFAAAALPRRALP
jgi:hypothetical protein